MRRVLGVTVALLVLTGCAATPAPIEPTGAPTAKAESLNPPAAQAIAATSTTLVADNRLSPLSGAHVYATTMLAALRAYSEAPREVRNAAAATAAAGAGLALMPNNDHADDEWEALALRYANQLTDDQVDEFTRVGTDTANETADAYRQASQPAEERPVTAWSDWRPTGVSLEVFQQPRWRDMPMLTDAQECDIASPDLGQVKAEAAQMLTWFSPESASDPIVTRWLGGPGSATPPGQWLQIAAGAALSHGLNETDTLRLLATSAIAGYDTSVLLWREKYEHNLARPETVWKTMQKPQQMIRETPPHPSYPSGHSGFSGAGAQVIKDMLGSVPVTLRLPADNGIAAESITYPNPDDALAEASQSRVLAGFHYPMDTTSGEELGSCAAKHAERFVDSLLGARS